MLKNKLSNKVRKSIYSHQTDTQNFLIDINEEELLNENHSEVVNHIKLQMEKQRNIKSMSNRAVKQDRGIRKSDAGIGKTKSFSEEVPVLASPLVIEGAEADPDKDESSEIRKSMSWVPAPGVESIILETQNDDGGFMSLENLNEYI